MNARTLLSIAILFFGVCLEAQQPESAQKPDSAQIQPVTQQTTPPQPTESADRWAMEQWIDVKQTPERVKRLVILGVDQKTAESFTSEDGFEFKQVEWKPIRAGMRQRHALLFLPCVLDNAYLYLLVLEGNSWRVTDRTVMDCHYDMDVSFEIEQIRNPAFEEILVHHDCVGRGTGILEQHFEVFAITDGKFRLELDTEDVVKAFRPYVDPRERYDLIQRSTFTIIPSSQSNSRVIEETRNKLLNDKLTVFRRQFRWNSAKGRYVPSKFVSVVAAPN